jgi:hypothetical protein
MKSGITYGKVLLKTVCCASDGGGGVDDDDDVWAARLVYFVGDIRVNTGMTADFSELPEQTVFGGRPRTPQIAFGCRCLLRYLNWVTTLSLREPSRSLFQHSRCFPGKTGKSPKSEYSTWNPVIDITNNSWSV